LLYEFEVICVGYGIDLQAPVFEITGATKELGAWCPTTKTMRLSRVLITNYPWAVTLQVVKHEMAHQLCSELFGEKENGHGPQFQKACSLLGVLPEFRRPRVATKEHLERVDHRSALGLPGQKLLEKVEKLFALGRSSNTHEAERALQKAHELMDKYQLDGLREAADRFYCVAVIDRKRKQIANYQRYICTILREFFFVHPVLSSQYDPFLDRTHKTIELLGTRENVVIAEYCYHFLENQLSVLWSIEKKRFQKDLRKRRNSYYLGGVKGFYQKLQDREGGRQNSCASDNKEHQALVLAEDHRLQEFVGQCFPQLERARGRRSTVLKDSYSDGVKAGKKISFSCGLTEEEVSAGRFIEGSVAQ